MLGFIFLFFMAAGFHLSWLFVRAGKYFCIPMMLNYIILILFKHRRELLSISAVPESLRLSPSSAKQVSPTIARNYFIAVTLKNALLSLGCKVELSFPLFQVFPFFIFPRALIYIIATSFLFLLLFPIYLIYC